MNANCPRNTDPPPLGTSQWKHERIYERMVRLHPFLLMKTWFANSGEGSSHTLLWRTAAVN